MHTRFAFFRLGCATDVSERSRQRRGVGWRVQRGPTREGPRRGEHCRCKVRIIQFNRFFDLMQSGVELGAGAGGRASKPEICLVSADDVGFALADRGVTGTHRRAQANGTSKKALEEIRRVLGHA